MRIRNKETNKKYKNSGLDGLSIIERICMICLPIMLVGIINIMLSQIGLKWYFTLIIAIVIVSLLISLIWWIVFLLIDSY